MQKSATAFGNISHLTVNRSKSYIYSEKVVFYSQHQYYETIFIGSTIVNAIKAVGRENVYIVLITDGSESDDFFIIYIKIVDFLEEKNLCQIIVSY